MTIVRVKSDYDIFVGEYPFHKQLYDELVSTLEEYPDKQDRNTNVKATMTEWNWDPISDRLKRLKNCVIQDAKSKFFLHAGYLYEHPLAFFESFWGNVYHKGDCAVTHHHLYSHLSMVYFLKTKSSLITSFINSIITILLNLYYFYFLSTNYLQNLFQMHGRVN